DWDRAARRIAGGLRALGVGAGDRVCILANTRPEWLHCDIGILMAGAATVPIYQSNLPAECEYIVNDCWAKVVFAENPLQVEKLVGERAKLKGVTRVIYFDDLAQLDKPDYKGRIEIKMAEAAGGESAWLESLTDLMARGDAWLASDAEALE